MPNARRQPLRPLALTLRRTATVAMATGALGLGLIAPATAAALPLSTGLTTAVSPARLAASYELTWLMPAPGHTVSTALGINDRGQVVGISRPTSAAQPQFTVVWDADDHAPVRLDNLDGSAFSRGFDVADNGVVVGEAFAPGGASVPVSWAGTSAHHIATLNASGTGVASDVNSRGLAAATAYNGSATRAYVVALGEDTVTELDVPADATLTRASAIAESGDVAGSAIVVEAHDDHSHSTTYAATWDDDGDVTVLPSIAEFAYSTARGINSKGVVVGEYQQSGVSTAVSWVDGTLTPLPPAALSGYPHTTATAVSDTGIVVGGASKFLGNSSFGGAAVAWDDQGAVNLNTRTELPAGVELRSATDVNAAGQIVGSAQTPDGPRGYLLTPIGPGPTPDPVPGQLATDVTMVPGAASYGRPTRLDVRVTSPSATPDGRVDVRLDDGLVASATLEAGRATVQLPPTVPAGTHTLGVAYAGTPQFAPDTVTRPLQVARARSAVKLRLSQRVAQVRKDRLTAAVSVAIPGSTLAPHGRAVILVGDRVVRTLRLVRTDGRPTAVALPRFMATGIAKVRVRYLGNPNVAAGKSKPVAVRVK